MVYGRGKIRSSGRVYEDRAYIQGSGHASSDREPVLREMSSGLTGAVDKANQHVYYSLKK